MLELLLLRSMREGKRRERRVGDGGREVAGTAVAAVAAVDHHMVGRLLLLGQPTTHWD